MSIYNCRSCPGPGTLTCPRHQACFLTPITVIAMDPPYFTPYTDAPETSTAGNVYEPQYTASGYPSQAPLYAHPIVSAKPCLWDFFLLKTFLSILGVEMADGLSLYHFGPLRCFLPSSIATQPSWCVGTDFPADECTSLWTLSIHPWAIQSKQVHINVLQLDFRRSLRHLPSSMRVLFRSSLKCRCQRERLLMRHVSRSLLYLKKLTEVIRSEKPRTGLRRSPCGKEKVKVTCNPRRSSLTLEQNRK